MRSAAMQSLTNDIRARHPGVVIGGIGDPAHKLRASDHNEDDTAGSRAAQSDTDSTPEHRAIDVMLGPVFSRGDALALIGELLGNPGARARLRFINFESRQWSRSTGWTPIDNSDDPHPTHIHISGWAPADENSAPWLSEGDDMDQGEQLILKTSNAGQTVGDVLSDLGQLRHWLLGEAPSPVPGDAAKVWPKAGTPAWHLAHPGEPAPVQLSDDDRAAIADLAAEAVLAQLLPTLSVDLIAEKVAEKLAARLAQ